MKNRISRSMVVVQTIIVLVALFVGAGPVFCQDFFIGKVLSVDRKQMEITLVEQHTERLFGTATEKETVLVRIAAVNDLPGDGRTVVLPGCVVAGQTIRLWGRKMVNEQNIFIATDIRGCKGGGCSSDPTGVRSRLLRSRKNSHRNQHLYESTEQGRLGSHDSEGTGHGGSGGNGGGNGGGGGGGGGGR